MSSPEPRKVLIITYYWPPSGGSGVQRWLKFVKYLPSLGWHPYVYTPENPSVETKDDTLLKDVPPEAEILRLPIWEPYSMMGKIAGLFGKKKSSRIDWVGPADKGIVSTVASWVRGNIFFPDPRVSWVRPSVQFLTDFLTLNKIDTIITTGPPHSMHLIGLRLKKKIPSLKWIADFRDPWSEWDLLDTLHLTKAARAGHRRLERKVLTTADRVITIAPFHVARFEALGGRKVDLITNGFDFEDFKGIVRKKTSALTIRHVGMVDTLRDPRPFMHAVKECILEDADLRTHIRIEFIGTVNAAFREFVALDSQLSAVTHFVSAMPHSELLSVYGETDIQLLVLAHTALAPGNLPGKFFEYLASGNYIFGVGPVEGDAAEILRSTNAGTMIDREDGPQMKSVLLEKYSMWKTGEVVTHGNVDAYSRYELTKQLSELIQK